MNCLYVIAAIGFIAFAQASPSEEKKIHHHLHHHGLRIRQCLGKNLTLSEEMKTALKSCPVKQPLDKPKTADDKETLIHHHHHKHRNFTCHIVCKYQAFGLISADNKFNKDKIEGFVKQVFPESVTVELTRDVTTCADKFGADLSIKDGKCDSYKPLFKCIHKAVKKNCKIEGDSKTESHI